MAEVRHGFWHCKLDEKSKDLTTFGTPFDRYRCARMPFGIAPAFENVPTYAADGHLEDSRVSSLLWMIS